MIKTILKSVMLTAIASLAMSGYVSAHHPIYFMDEDLYYTIDENISDMHNEIIGDVTDEDFELIGSLTQSMDANVSPTAAAGDAVANQDSNQNEMTGENPASTMILTGRSNQGSASQTGR